MVAGGSAAAAGAGDGTEGSRIGRALLAHIQGTLGRALSESEEELENQIDQMETAKKWKMSGLPDKAGAGQKIYTGQNASTAMAAAGATTAMARKEVAAPGKAAAARRATAVNAGTLPQLLWSNRPMVNAAGTTP